MFMGTESDPHAEDYEGMLTDLNGFIASFAKEDASLESAARMAESMIHLHDGKDYVDDSLPHFNTVFDALTARLEIKTQLALAAVRMLAHSWQWEPSHYHKLLAVIKTALDDDTVDHKIKAVAVLAVDEIFLADNDSETEAEDKTDGEVLKLLGSVLLPKPVKGQPKLTIGDFLHDKLEPYLKSPCAALTEAASSLLVRLPTRKRGRDDKAPAQAVPKGFGALALRLRELLDAETPDTVQIAAVLKGIVKVLPEAAFEAIEDLCDEDIEHFSKVNDHIVHVQESIERVFRIPGKGGVTYDDPARENEEKCPHAHFDVGVAIYASVLAIRSSELWGIHCNAAGRTDWGAPVSEQSIRDLLLVWRGHRYHKLGNDFELIEKTVSYVAEKNEATWKAVAEQVPISMPWTCCPDPFAPKPAPGARPNYGFGFGGF
ncbi:Hypothetical protein, putative [Bodo saltans]|uniref:Uncharacterized protein n=1 Tax=Bodo saltans TaxID=75058 RepID=A0A0S4JRS7_BODSA|nr:Hypothetical protein, putative [Bodo saltans]|eukprot:CUG94246.1 Hypothetical protein, putative [Bodo saltans]